MRRPQRRELVTARARAYYFVRATETVRVPVNLELPPEAREAQEPRRPLLQRLRRRPARAWWQRKHVVNVLSAADELLYTFEREKRGVWTMFSYPDRALLATIRFRSRALFGPTAHGHAVDFHANGIGHRKIRRKASAFDSYNVFYTTDGAPYHWASSTRALERVINYGGKDKELRHVVAQAKPLRRRHLNYELIVDASLIDPVVAIATAFISIKTQWTTDDCPVASNKTVLNNVERVGPRAEPLASTTSTREPLASPPADYLGGGTDPLR